jgi:hypothetical protein
MTDKPKRPEFVNGVRVRMPEGYDFSTAGTVYVMQGRTGWSMGRITD